MKSLITFLHRSVSRPISAFHSRCRWRQSCPPCGGRHLGYHENGTFTIENARRGIGAGIFRGITPVSNRHLAARIPLLPSGPRYCPEKRSRALRGRNPTRDIRADGAPMVHQAPDRAYGWGPFCFSLPCVKAHCDRWIAAHPAARLKQRAQELYAAAARKRRRRARQRLLAVRSG